MLLIGGTSLVPLVQNGFARVFSGELAVSANPHLVVTGGATLQTRASAIVSTQVPIPSRRVGNSFDPIVDVTTSLV